MHRIRLAWRKANLAVAGLMSTGTDDQTMGSRPPQEHRILVVGKSGNGKSSLCNTLCGGGGGHTFPVGHGMAATTRSMHVHTVNRYGQRFTVVDTPDVTNLEMTRMQMEDEVFHWRQATHPHPTTVLLAVRCDVRYTPEEHAIYREILRLWGDNSLRDRLVVAFTFGDLQDNDLEKELRTVCPELKNVLADAQHRYVMFTNKGPEHQREHQVQQLLNIMMQRPSINGGKTPTSMMNLSRALTALFVISGLCFAATYTANKSGPAIGFGLLCLGALVGVVALRIKDKMH